jgi:hypothetical protein
MNRAVAAAIARGAVLWGPLVWTWAPCPAVAQQGDPVTFAEHVAPILFRECAVCHRPGGSGPFSVLRYDEVLPWAERIATETESRRMPPWLPQRGYGTFVGKRRLHDEEIAVLRRWVEAGAPRGDAEHAPSVPDFASGWQLGEPDLVIPFPRYTVPANGQDIYRNLVAAVPITGRHHVAAVDIHPGDPRIVHHARLLMDTTQSSREMDARDAAPGFDGMELVSEAGNPPGHFIGWTPGKMPYRGADELAWAIRPGTDLVLQLHLRPTGTPEEVEPVVGLYYAAAPPAQQSVLVALSSKMIDIPAGERNHVVTDTYRLPVDIEALGVYPHAHYLGKTLEGFATLPDGRRTWLLRIPEWDFNWQDEYHYAEPIALPAGAVLTMRYTYDNSVNNPRNPNDPPRRVRYGPQSTDEMGDLVIQALPRTREDRERLLEDLAWKYEMRQVTFLAHQAALAAREGLARGDSAEAVRQFQRALLHRPTPPVHAAIAEILAGQGEFAAAALHAEWAARLAAAAGDERLARMMEERLERYRRGRPD